MKQKSANEYFATHHKAVLLTYGKLDSYEGKIRLVMKNGLQMVSNDIFDLQDFYEEYSNEEGEFRNREVCGKPYDEGYMTEGGTFYACSDECFRNDADARYGKGKWKRTEELTEEEKKNVLWNDLAKIAIMLIWMKMENGIRTIHFIRSGSSMIEGFEIMNNSI